MIGSRIKKLRKALDLTQQEFSLKIGVKRNTIAKYETGRGDPIDAVISLICREFNVSEEWLRTGAGGDAAMFEKKPETQLDELAKIYDLDDLDRRIILRYLQLSERDREVVKQYMHSIVSDLETAAPQSDQDTLKQKADEYSDMAREQFILEESTGSPVSSVKESDVG